MCKFRDLTKDDIDVRISQYKEGKGCSLLLYKNARVDMNILDETVGSSNWQDDFYEKKGILFCKIGINTNYSHPDMQDRWIWKGDAGSESNAEAKKGNASDARKRAGFAWGIGRELYTAPFIWIKANDIESKYDNFLVEKIKIVDKKIVGLAIFNKTLGKRIFVWTDKSLEV